MAGLQALQVEPATSGESVATTLARLRADPAVQFADIDQRRYPHAAPNDPLFAGQWYLQKAAATPSAVDAVGAWNTHPRQQRPGDRRAGYRRALRTSRPVACSVPAGDCCPATISSPMQQSANDGDGRDADASDPGDWVSTADTSTSPLQQGCTVGGKHLAWHARCRNPRGAHQQCAGIAGAELERLDTAGARTGQVRRAPTRTSWPRCCGPRAQHVSGVPDNPYPAKVINMSLGAPAAARPATSWCINQLTAQGVLVVVSAGNEGGPVDSPANCPGVAAVAGLRHVGTKVGFSSLGPAIALSAPAGNCVNISAGAALPVLARHHRQHRRNGAGQRFLHGPDQPQPGHQLLRAHRRGHRRIDDGRERQSWFGAADSPAQAKEPIPSRRHRRRCRHRRPAMSRSMPMTCSRPSACAPRRPAARAWPALPVRWRPHCGPLQRSPYRPAYRRARTWCCREWQCRGVRPLHQRLRMVDRERRRRRPGISGANTANATVIAPATG